MSSPSPDPVSEVRGLREALEWFAWFARKSKGTVAEVTVRALEQNPYLRALTPAGPEERGEGLDMEALYLLRQIWLTWPTELPEELLTRVERWVTEAEAIEAGR